MSHGRPITKTEDFPVKGTKFGMAISWDSAGPMPQVDLDLQGVAFSHTGRLLDAVYYNNLKALGRGLTHSGDETTGEKRGFDEVIWVSFPKLPSDVQLIAFVVACYKGGAIRDAKNAVFHVLEDALGHEVGRFSLAQTANEAALVGSLLRTPRGGGWMFRALDMPAKRGRHFIDILEPLIGDFVRSVIPSAPRRIKAAFAMEKGAVVGLPESDQLRRVVAGLGWDVAKGKVDLDVSAVLLDADSREMDCCFFGNQEIQGVQHSGDNLTGEGSGDDETISIDLQAVSPAVRQIYFVINIYSPGKTFQLVANPRCRLVTAEGEEFCRYQLAEAGDQQALVMARLVREPGEGRWAFQAVGAPCRGRTYKDSMPSIVQHAHTRLTDAALLRSSTALSFADEQPPPRRAGAPAPPAEPLVESSQESGQCGLECCML